MAGQEELAVDTVLFDRADAPSVYVLLSGELSIAGREDRPVQTAGPGDAVGVGQTLTGRPMGMTARVVRPGTALRILREDVLEFLGDHVDVLQALFDAVLPHPPTRSLVDEGDAEA
jgi:CRP-like cAMP-binding protein